MTENRLLSCGDEPVRLFIAIHPEGYAVPSSASHDRGEVLCSIFRMTGHDFNDATQIGWKVKLVECVESNAK